MNQVMVDLWIGFYSDPKNRIAKPLLFLRKTEDANLYAKPIDGVEVTVGNLISSPFSHY
jgi:Cu2+-containing amine oxidase